MTDKKPTGPVIHPDIIQGTDEWLAARCGLLTASELKLIITPTTLKPASNDKASSHLYELAAQRITKFVEPQYISSDMLRGMAEEQDARKLYAQHYAPVTQAGFITNDRWGFALGYSPDGLVGENGLIECKSRRQKFQVETIISNTVPVEHIVQVQAGMMIAERDWLDYVSYCGGMPLAVIRVHPDEKVQNAILESAGMFEKKLAEQIAKYEARVIVGKHIPTERVSQEMYV